MSINRKQYTAEFKLEAVRLAQELDNVAEAARDLGIHENVLHRWKNQLAAHGNEAFPGNGKLRSERRRCASCGARTRSCARNARF